MAALSEKADLENANGRWQQHQYEAARILYKQFQTKYPNSKYLLSARLGEAQSLEGLERWSEAAEIYRSVHDSAMQLQPEIATLAQYRLSFCYEALGDDIKAVASLLDCMSKAENLPEEVAQAEIPARLAMLYGKVQNRGESNKYMEIAQKGLQSLQGRKDLPPATLAKTYYEMGAVSLNQISSENFSQAILGQKAVQRYLFRAVNLQVTPWSGEAAGKLKKNYRDLWNVLLQMPGVDGVDAESVARNRRTEQISLGAEFLDLIQNAENYRPFNDEKMNPLEKDFFAYLSDVKKKAQDLIFQPDADMGLTEESQKLNGIKRPGHIQDKEKTQPLPPKSQDPNL